MKKGGYYLLRMFGWRIDKDIPQDVKKCVIVMGPHTSNWDFVIGRIAFYTYGLKAKFLIKKEAFVPGFGWLLKWMGGIPVDRKAKNNLTNVAAEMFSENDSLYLVFTPEGTRSYNPDWKKGFYYIAEKAKVPIYIAYIDYEHKRGGFKGKFDPTGDIKKDIDYIKSRLRQHKGKIPENGIR